MIIINSEITDASELEKRVIDSLNKRKITFSKEEFFRNLKIIDEKLCFVHENFNNMCKSYELKERPINSHRRIFGKIIILIKKIIRKSTRWLFFSYTNQQVEYNSCVNLCLGEMIKVQDKLVQNLKYLENKDED